MKNLRALFAIFVVFAVIYVCYKVVPVYFTYYQFQDVVEDEARMQSYTPKSENDMRDTVYHKAQQMELPLTSPEQIIVQRNGATVTISTEYTVHVDIPIHPFDLNFKVATKNKAI